MSAIATTVTVKNPNKNAASIGFAPASLCPMRMPVRTGFTLND